MVKRTRTTRVALPLVCLTAAIFQTGVVSRFPLRDESNENVYAEERYVRSQKAIASVRTHSSPQYVRMAHEQYGGRNVNANVRAYVCCYTYY
uniref:Putative secreted protein n=1 Tax=Ixodes ricinus TaxID=34613 RepID=A0A6B0UH56_IXORI